MRNIHPNSIVYPQYGAQFGGAQSTSISQEKSGNYIYDKIACINTSARCTRSFCETLCQQDGFIELFGNYKSPSIQESIFREIGYDIEDHAELQYIDQRHHAKYKNILCNTYLKFNSRYKNVFVLINNNQDVIDDTINLLKNHIENNYVDLVIVKCDDTIIHPIDRNIKAQSLEAYIQFVEMIRPYFRFTYTFS